MRNYAETNHLLYLHHTATIEGSAGQKYSFTALPTVERTGEAFAQLAVEKFRGKKIGIIKRDSPNWEPGVVAFKKVARANGLKIVAEREVAANKGNYTDEILAMRNAGAEVVWGWENALISTQILKQAKAQNYSPNWLLFPFNLTSQTLGDDALEPAARRRRDVHGVQQGRLQRQLRARTPTTSKLFEEQYAKYDPDIDLGGVGGDLLFLNWQAQKGLYDMLLACGKDCTRNRFVDILTSLHASGPTQQRLPARLHPGRPATTGRTRWSFMQTYKSPSGKVNWRNTKACVGPA